jgi:hypothetical protein
VFQFCSGALGAGLAIFSRFAIIGTSVHPYSLNGAPIDVIAGDWFVGKAAASVLITHPVLGEVQIFNTHVSIVRSGRHISCQPQYQVLRERRRSWSRTPSRSPFSEFMGICQARQTSCGVGTICDCGKFHAYNVLTAIECSKRRETSTVFRHPCP